MGRKRRKPKAVSARQDAWRRTTPKFGRASPGVFVFGRGRSRARRPDPLRRPVPPDRSARLPLVRRPVPIRTAWSGAPARPRSLRRHGRPRARRPPQPAPLGQRGCQSTGRVKALCRTATAPSTCRPPAPRNTLARCSACRRRYPALASPSPCRRWQAVAGPPPP